MGVNDSMKRSFEKKSLAVVIIVLFFGSIIPSMVAERPVLIETIYVDDDNTDGPWDGTQDHPYQRIQDGVDATGNGDTVFVYSGIYYENLVVDKSIILQGEDKNTTILDAQKDGTPIRIIADECLISDFTILNCEGLINQDWEDAVVKIDKCNNVIIKDNILNAGDVQLPTYLHYSAIELNGCTHCEIINNYITQDKPETFTIGIALHDNSSNNIILGNNVSQFNFGFHVGWNGNNRDNTISENHFHHNCFGTYVENGYNEIINNIVEYNTEVGINIQNGYHYTISGNIVQFNGAGKKFHCGIELMGDLSNNNNYVSDNLIFKNNPTGLQTEYSYRNVITRNNFIDNYGESGAPERYWGNAYVHIQDGFFKKDNFRNNYWSDSLGIFPKMIPSSLEIMKVFTIEWINFDWHPAQKPYDISMGVQ